MGTKIDGDSCYTNAMEDEPMFILLARDANAPRLVREWADQRADAIDAWLKPESDRAQVKEALATATRMEEWRERNFNAWKKSTE